MPVLAGRLGLSFSQNYSSTVWIDRSFLSPRFTILYENSFFSSIIDSREKKFSILFLLQKPDFDGSCDLPIIFIFFRPLSVFCRGLEIENLIFLGFRWMTSLTVWDFPDALNETKLKQLKNCSCLQTFLSF